MLSEGHVVLWGTHMYVLLLGDLYTSGLLITKRICSSSRSAIFRTVRILWLLAALFQ